MGMRAKSLQSCPTLCNPTDCIAHKAPLSMGFSRQDYWSRLPFPPPGIFLNQGSNLYLLEVSCIEKWVPTTGATWEALRLCYLEAELSKIGVF